MPQTPALFALALTVLAAAGCAAPAALAPEGVSAARSPIYQALQDPGAAAYGKRPAQPAR